MDILYSDKQIVVCIKPAGLDSERDVPEALKEQLGGEIFPIHRLDQNVGGVMVFARTKQAAAAVGQCELMYTYDKLFSEYHHTVAQILLTGSDFSHEDRYQNFKNTLNRLLELGVLPIINENDTIATDEIKVGDNDTLSAMVSVGVNADLLVLLSDIDGLYTADPRKNSDATLIPEVFELTDALMTLGGDEGSSFGTGGMRTKLHAAKICSESGCDMVIMNGSTPALLYDLFDGISVGTRFYAKKVEA